MFWNIGNRGRSPVWRVETGIAVKILCFPWGLRFFLSWCKKSAPAETSNNWLCFDANRLLPLQERKRDSPFLVRRRKRGQANKQEVVFLERKLLKKWNNTEGRTVEKPRVRVTCDCTVKVGSPISQKIRSVRVFWGTKKKSNLIEIWFSWIIYKGWNCLIELSWSPEAWSISPYKEGFAIRAIRLNRGVKKARVVPEPKVGGGKIPTRFWWLVVTLTRRRSAIGIRLERSRVAGKLVWVSSEQEALSRGL